MGSHATRRNKEIVQVQHIPTKENLADIFTKIFAPLRSVTFLVVSGIGLLNKPPLKCTLENSNFAGRKALPSLPSAIADAGNPSAIADAGTSSAIASQ